MRKSTTGFTIVELLIVIVVIAILAAITIVAYTGIQGQARQSARLSEMSQIQKQIQVEALQRNGVELTINAPIAYTMSFDEVPLTRPLEGTQEATLYVVFDTNGVLGTDYIEVARFTPNTTTNLFLRTSTSTYMGSRIDTSAQTNATGNVPIPIRNTTGRHVGWITTKTGNFYLNYDSHTAIAYSLSAHSGWDFTGVRLNSGRNGVALLAFAEYHDETTRQQVLQWLDRKHTITFYE